MDTTENRKEEVNQKTEGTPSHPFKIRVAPELVEEYNKTLAWLDTEYQKRDSELDKALKKLWTDKSSIWLMKSMTNSDWTTNKNLWTLFYWIDYLEARLSNLESIVQSITKFNLSHIEERIQKLQQTLAEPELAEVAKFIHDVNENIQKARQAQKEYGR